MLCIVAQSGGEIRTHEAVYNRSAANGLNIVCFCLPRARVMFACNENVLWRA